MEPLYTAANVKPAYQLRWSLALFAKSQMPPSDSWLPGLKEVVERDGVRILEVQLQPHNIWQFYLSTQPHVAPLQIFKSVKGRLQHLLRPTNPDAFQRNFYLTAVGDARREIVENYVASQLGHHQMADPRVQENLKRYQLEFPEINLAEHQHSSHGVYVYSLHLVLVHEGRLLLKLLCRHSRRVRHGRHLDIFSFQSWFHRRGVGGDPEIEASRS
ncbi:MAG: hypothetical protein ACM3U2_22975 [Deltaproteobacteria bacterium]